MIKAIILRMAMCSRSRQGWILWVNSNSSGSRMGPAIIHLISWTMIGMVVVVATETTMILIRRIWAQAILDQNIIWMIMSRAYFRSRRGLICRRVRDNSSRIHQPKVAAIKSSHHFLGRPEMQLRLVLLSLEGVGRRPLFHWRMETPHRLIAMMKV